MPKLVICTLLFSWSYSFTLFAQPGTDSFLHRLLLEHGSPQLRMILEHPDSFRCQIIYTKIDRDEKNRPYFHTYAFNLDRSLYFNPASTVKLPLALLAMEKMNNLKIPGLSKYSTMLTDSAYRGQTRVVHDSSSSDGLPSLAQYIRKIFLVSDNDAYNRLYEMVGQETINRRLWQMGYKDVRITRRFQPMDADENQHTNPIRFRNGNNSVFAQPPVSSSLRFDEKGKILIGKAHYNWNDSLIHEPMDFSAHNNLPLEDLHQILKSVIFPESVPVSRRFNLTKDDYSFLYQYMSEYPRESRFPHYDTAEFYDSYGKFFLYKSGKTPVPDYIRIFNKPGWSYGFLTDMAYIVDFKNNVEWMMGATIYVNSDGILNDDKYEYDETGYPFFKEIGQILYQYELQRKREVKPDLSKFRMHYE
jgi:hypothetical protein